MHIHASQASALGNSLAGAQAAETALSMRRARELRDAASRLRAIAMDVSPVFTAHPQTVAPTDSGGSRRISPQTQTSPDSPSDPQTMQMIAAWSGASAPVARAISPA